MFRRPDQLSFPSLLTVWPLHASLGQLSRHYNTCLDEEMEEEIVSNRERDLADGSSISAIAKYHDFINDFFISLIQYLVDVMLEKTSKKDRHE